MPQQRFPMCYRVALLGALGLVANVGVRKSFAIVMTYVTASQSHAAEEQVFTNCSTSNSSHPVHVTMGVDRVFSLHALYYAGFVIFAIPVSTLAPRVSPKSLISIAVVLTSAITACLPYIITGSQPLLFILRLLQGGLDSTLHPCIIGMLSACSTTLQKSRLVSVFYTGGYLAPAISAMLSATFMCYVSWESILFFYGGFGLLWNVLWTTLVPSPDDKNLSSTNAGPWGSYNAKMTNTKIPWRHIVTSPTAWCLVCALFTQSFVYAILVFGQPQYFHDSFNLSVADSGLLTTAPHVGLSVCCILGGVVADKLLQHRFSTTCVRKLLFGFGKLLEGLCLVGLHFTSDWRLAVALVTTAVTFGGLSAAGYLPLAADMAPQFATNVFSFGSIGYLGSIASSAMIAIVCGKNVAKPIEGWQTLFLVAGLVDVIVVVMFVTMVKAEVQPWAVVTTDKLRGAKETDPLLAASHRVSFKFGDASLAASVDMSHPSGPVMLQQADPYEHTVCLSKSKRLCQSTQNL